MLIDPKGILQSRAVWSNIVGFVAMVAVLLGAPADVLGDQSKLVDALLGIVAGVSHLAGIYFRVTATARLTGVVSGK